MKHEKGTCPICDSNGICAKCKNKIEGTMVVGIINNKTAILCQPCNEERRLA